MYFTAPSIVECQLCTLYNYSTNRKNSSEKVLRALTSCTRFPFWEMKPFIWISQYNCLGEGHWLLGYFSVSSLCFGQISSICEILILLGYYLKYWYSLWYYLLSNCKKPLNISYSSNTVLIPTCFPLWREKEKMMPLNARLHGAMWSVSSCYCQWPSCAAPLWAENLSWDNVLDGSWQAFTWDSLTPRALHTTAVCLSFALQLSVEREWIYELRHSTCARSSEEVLQLMCINCCERNILKVSLHRLQWICRTEFVDKSFWGTYSNCIFLH